MGQNFPPELIAKAKTAKSAEELLELAKANNVALTEEEAKTYFAQLHANAVVSDAELEAVAGGCNEYDPKCPNCGASLDGTAKCKNCGKFVSAYYS